MARIKRPLLIISAVALLITTLGTSAAAIVIPPHVAIVQGMPGVRVDLCIDGKEIRGNVRYGWKTIRKISGGTHQLKVFKKSPKKCKGVKLAQKTFTVPEAGDVTLVVKRGSPKVLVFDNSALPPIDTAAHQATFVMRHAAKTGGLNFYAGNASPLTPTADTFFVGDEIVATTVPAGTYLVAWATRAGGLKALFGPVTISFEGDKRYEAYLVGTKRANYKLVLMVRPYLFGHI